MSKKQKLIRVGVIGVGRGQSFIAGASELTGLKLVAICDTWKEKLEETGKRFKVATYTDYDKFLGHDMDAVVLANYFHQHAPFAIKALKAGKHVMSETASNFTLAEGVELCRTVEKTGRIYMLAENYPYTKFNLEMQRLYKAGEIGEVMYAEGEYMHPMQVADVLRISHSFDHWRFKIPPTYYCTHALAPLMHITNTMPVRVNGFSFAGPAPKAKANSLGRGDFGSVIICQMDNGAIFRVIQGGPGGHSCWYRLHGTEAAMEMTRGPGYFGPQQLRIWREEWNRRGKEPLEKVYSPDWPSQGELAAKAGHGGGDFWTNYEFANAIRSGKQPFLNVYRGVTMSSVGILAWRSALKHGAPVDVPDFSSEASRKKYEHDHWSVFAKDGFDKAPSSLLGDRQPTKKAYAFARKIWKEMGVKVK
jgi:predicted dehydrogenase